MNQEMFDTVVLKLTKNSLAKAHFILMLREFIDETEDRVVT